MIIVGYGVAVLLGALGAALLALLLRQMLAAAGLAAQAYQDGQYRAGYLAALTVVAAALGLECQAQPAIVTSWHCDEEVQP